MRSPLDGSGDGQVKKDPRSFRYEGLRIFGRRPSLWISRLPVTPDVKLMHFMRSLMQRVCRFDGEVKRYEEDPYCLLDEDHRICPICDSRHRLRRHGLYRRWAYLPGEAEPRSLPIVRLLCAVTGRTVSLLPDFCLPRRQHGPGVVGLFLHALAIEGRTLGSSLEAAGLEDKSHSLAQSFLRGFKLRRHSLGAYLASRLRRWKLPPPDHRHEIAREVSAILELSQGIVRSFVLCGRELHSKFGVGLI